MSLEYNLLFLHDTVPTIDELLLLLQQSDLFIEKKDGKLSFKEYRGGDYDGWPARVIKENASTIYLSIYEHKSDFTSFLYNYMKDSNVTLVDDEDDDPLPWSTIALTDDMKKG